MDAKAVVEAFYAATEAGDMARIESCIADDFTFSGPVPKPIGKTEYLTLQRNLLAAMPNWKLNPKNIKAQGNKVTVTVHVTGTHTGTLASIRPGMSPVPATGKEVVLPEEQVTITVHDDKLSSLQSSAVPGGGVAGILAQIGVSGAARTG